MGGAFLVLAGFAGCGDLRVGAGQRRPLVVDAAEQDDGELGAYVYADRCRGRAVGLPCQGGGAAPAAAGRRCAGWSAWRGLSCRGGTRRRRESGGPVVAATGEAEQYSDQGDRYGRHGGAWFAHGRLPDVLVGAACRWWARRCCPVSCTTRLSHGSMSPGVLVQNGWLGAVTAVAGSSRPRVAGSTRPTARPAGPRRRG